MSTRIMETAERERLPQPTKEEVEEIRELIVPFAGSGRLSTRFELIIRLCDAYLALREDYKEANVLLNGYDKLLTKLRDRRDKDQEEIRKFHADNEALRARVE